MGNTHHHHRYEHHHHESPPPQHASPAPKEPEPSPKEPEPLCFPEPWRNLPETDEEMLDYIKLYQPDNDRTGHLRIMLHGPVGAGKSSYINSVQSAVRGKISGRAMTDADFGVSCTLKYKTWKITKESRKTHCNFVFNDIMGLEEHDNGISVEDIKLALRGRVAEGYEFNPDRPLTEESRDYNKSPSLSDKIHVLVSVVPATSMDNVSDEVVKKLRDVRLAANRLEIPQITIITKVDDACPEVKKDIKNLYKSKELKQKVETLHTMLGIPLNCIFLVKNYSSEQETSTDMNVQILHPLKQMISFGEDFLDEQ